MNAKPEPIWIRLPRAGETCCYSNIPRSTLYLLATSGRIESRKIYPTGGSRGVLLIRLSSLLDFIEAQAPRTEVVDDDATAAIDNLPYQQGRELVDKAPSPTEDEVGRK